MSTDNQLQLFNLPQTDRNKLPYRHRDTFQLGDAGENLVMARLSLWGYKTVKSAAGSVFDAIAEVDTSLVKIQVKSTAQVTPKMTFEFKRSSMRAGPRNFRYKGSDFDIAALVSIPDQRVLFYAGIHNRISCNREQFVREGNEYASWQNALTTFLSKERSMP